MFAGGRNCPGAAEKAERRAAKIEFLAARFKA